ncbi:hypothetical protein EYR36_009250 [Pleurotus pulmonarius]|nr:hypothetical protein EYR36_009250 [Pleurotus pulmonarius]KAF4592749.1 hypothetical protein EYR38_008449 [Pleurotus pulmonarius]
MLTALNDLAERSQDPSPLPSLQVTQLSLTGNAGRPRIEIDPNFLRHALDLRGPHTLGPLLKCSSRTVRRRALELGLVEPGHPVYADVDNGTGAVQRVWTSTTPPMSTLSDAELDAETAEILNMFPHFGRRMIIATLLTKGHRVSQKRVQESYLRVWGAPARFGDHPIIRKEYWVPGVNSLWHHDGNHDLIRYVVGIKANNNNRKETVLEVFMNATEQHGWPSRMRGDHGVENGLCALAMEEYRGRGRGSYIWGRSVHNCRIERLWLDYAHGVVVKWKPFFEALEASHGLDHDNFAHIWLLHHLFMAALQDDIRKWSDAWNLHKIAVPGGGQKSPRELFTFGLLADGG